MPNNICLILLSNQHRIIFASVFFLFGVISPLFPQQNVFKTVEFDFLQKNEPYGVTCIVQDHQGLIWMSGKNGLIAYNGYNTKRYFHNPEDSSSLLSNSQEKIFVDQTGVLWVSNEKGVSRYDRENDAFHHYSFEENPYSPDVGFNLTGAQDFTEDNQDRLWMILQGGKLYQYDRENDLFISHLDDPANPQNMLKDILRIVEGDKKGNIWIGSGFGIPTDEAGLVKYNPQTGQAIRFRHKPEDNSSLIDNRISAILEDRTGKIWIGTYKNGLHIYDETKNNFIRVNELPTGSTLQPIQADNLQFWGSDEFIQILTQDQKGNYWISTSGLGLKKYNPNTGESTVFGPFNDFPFGSDLLWSLLEDRSGNIWAGYLLNQEIYKMDNYGLNISIYEDLKNCSDSYESKDKNGVYWFPTLGSGLKLYDMKKGLIRTYLHDPSDKMSIGSNNVFTAYEDQNGDVWVGLGSGRNIQYNEKERWGIAKLNKKTGAFTHYNIPNEKDPKISSPVLSITDDQKGFLWLDTWINGIYKFHKASGTLSKFKLPGSGNINTGMFNDFVDNILYIIDHTNSILYKYNNENEEFNILLEGYRTTKVLEDADGWYWMGTEGQGLLHYHPEKDSLIIYNNFPGISSNRFINFLKDDEGFLWISCSSGIVRFDPKKKEFMTEGLPKGYPRYNAYKGKDGRFIFGFEDEMYSFYPNEMRGNPFPPQISITGLDISGEPHKIANIEDLELNFRQNNLTFHYLGTHYSDPEKNKYKYRLSPFENNWSEAGLARSARYTNLNPGKYIFEVNAANSNGVWSDEIEKLSIVIYPPWWKTRWAFLLFTLTGIGTIAGVSYRYRYKIKEKQLELENKQKHLEANRRFVPKDFLHILGKDSILDLKLGDQTQLKMTVLFADIRSYTSLAESMSPEENFSFINEFLGRMGPIIHRNGGFINQYSGDGIMALFKDQHHLAIKAAIEMQKDIQVFNKERLWQKKPSIRVGIGLNTGQLMLGVIGDENRYDSNVISDTVNTASRVEGLTKLFGASVIVSEKTLKELELENAGDYASQDSGLLFRFLGKIQVKGKSEILEIFDLFEGDQEKVVQDKMAAKKEFETALHLYFDSNFGSAADKLKILRENYPEDKAIKYYFERAVHYSIEGVKEGWNGVEEMQFK